MSALALTVGAETASAQSMVDLGTLGGIFSDVWAVSADGSVIIGHSYVTGDPVIHTFKYAGTTMSDLFPLMGLDVDVSADGSVIVGMTNTGHAAKYVGATMTDLGTLGGTSSRANAVSADGSVIVGDSNTSGGSGSHAFMYAGTTMTDLGTLGGTVSGAVAVSADGSVVVGSSTVAGGYAHAFKYAGATMTDLGTLGGSRSFAYAVSADGSTIVGYSQIAGDSVYHAFMDAGSTMTDLGTLGGTFSIARAVSSDGSVIVGESSLSGEVAIHVFKYTGSTMTDLGTLGGTNSSIGIRFHGLSADGSVIVGSSQIAGDFAWHAFMYVGSKMTDLGTLGGTNSNAQAVSADGSTIVGNSQIAGDSVYHAFAYHLGKIIDLPNTYVDFSRSANLVRNAMVQRSAALALMMDYDCTSFGISNGCISFGTRYSALTAANNEGAGELTVAYRVLPQLRLGAFIDYRVSQASTAGISYKRDMPTFGAFLGYDQVGDGTGIQAKLSGAINRGDVTVTRLASQANTEAGQGSSTLSSFAVAAEIGWGIRVSDTWVATPYAGVRFTEAKLGAYIEALTDAVKFPISYAAYWQQTTIATSGVRLAGQLTDRIGFSMAAGAEYDVRSKMSNYSGVSDIPGLTSFSLANPTATHRARPAGSLGLTYDIASNQRIGIKLSARTLPYSSHVSSTSMASYEVAF